MPLTSHVSWLRLVFLLSNAADLGREGGSPLGHCGPPAPDYYIRVDATLQTRQSEATTSFWPWFAAHSAQLARDAGQDDEELPKSLLELDRRVRELHPDLTWEIGPWETDLYFALSPGGNAQLLPLTRALTQAAPPLVGWHILPAKPAKSWNRSLAFEGVFIDASHWRYLLTLSSHQLDSLHLAVPHDYGLTAAQLEQAARIVLESELGEETLLGRVTQLTVVVQERWPHGPRSKPLYELWAELRAGLSQTSPPD